MKKAKFRIVIFGGYTEKNKYQEIDGYIVMSEEHNLNKDIVLSIHKKDSEWIGGEYQTGCRLASGSTRKNAIQNTINSIEKNGYKIFYNAIEGFINKYGITNKIENRD